jgi:hypothetical protein
VVSTNNVCWRQIAAEISIQEMDRRESLDRDNRRNGSKDDDDDVDDDDDEHQRNERQMLILHG